MKLQYLRIYQYTNVITDIIWNEVIKWNYIAQDTVGK